MPRARQMQYFESDSKLDLPMTARDFELLADDADQFGLGLRPQLYRFLGSGSATVDAAGEATISVGIPPSGYQWFIERLTVTASGTARVYVGPAQAQNLQDFTPLGTEDISDNSSPIFVPVGMQAIIVFTGATPAQIAIASWQIRAEPV